MINETPPGFEKDKKNISIDFDGVIHDWSKGWHDGTCYGEPIKGALEAIKLLSKKYQIIVFTAKCRPDRPPINGKTGKQLVIEWLKKHDLLDYISEVTHEKPRAMIYIDDKGYRFQSWNNTIKYLEENI